MIDKDKFVEIINIYQKHETELDKLCDVFTTAFDSPLIDCFWQCHNMLIKAYFDAMGYEIITDFLCNEVILENGNEVKDIDTLWDIVKDYRL